MSKHNEVCEWRKNSLHNLRKKSAVLRTKWNNSQKGDGKMYRCVQDLT